MKTKIRAPKKKEESTKTPKGPLESSNGDSSHSIATQMAIQALQFEVARQYQITNAVDIIIFIFLILYFAFTFKLHKYCLNRKLTNS